MKDENWTDQMKNLGDIRLFSSLALKKTQKGAFASAQEVDMLFRIALAYTPKTPHELSVGMGTSKTIISRLIENLTQKDLIERQYDRTDGRSYSLIVTDRGKQALDRIYYYYLEPLYDMQKSLGEEDFLVLMELIRKANNVMAQKSSET